MRSDPKKLLLEYVPATLTLIATVVTLVLYSTVYTERAPSIYCAIVLIGLLPFVLIFFNRKFSLGFPFGFVALVCLHFVFAVDMGTALLFYDNLPWWDLFVHGYFGFLCCAALYYLCIRFFEKKPTWFHFLLFVFITIAFAALWEIYEYVADLFLHRDMQCVESAIAAGKSPLTDTMTDIMIAIAGAFLYCAGMGVRALILKRKAKKSLGEEDPSEEEKTGNGGGK